MILIPVAELSTGGGIRVALAMTKVLLEAGYDVGLVALRGLDIEDLEKIHGISLRPFIRENRCKIFYMFNRGKSFKLAPPAVSMLNSLYLEKLIQKLKPRVIIFHDDVSKPVLGKKWPVKTVLYSHFPYIARILFNINEHLISAEVPDRRYILLSKYFYYPLTKPLILYDKNIDMLIANSTVTRLFMSKIWKDRNIKVIYPPVMLSPQLLLKEKEDIIVALATIQPNKRLGDVISAFANIKQGNLYIIGHRSSHKYLEMLLRRVEKLGIKGRVKFLLDVNEEIKWEILFKAKALVSAARFEPFGINVIEGMAAGCVPIVYAGPLSGPWIDITEYGKYGLGFRSIDELVEKIELVLTRDRIFKQLSGKALERASKFSISEFKTRFLEEVLKVL